MKIIEFIKQNKEIKSKLENKEEISKKRFQKRKAKNKFVRQDEFRFKRLHKVWRRPKGIQSKMRKQLKNEQALVKIGYRTPKIIRGILKNGFYRKYISQKKELLEVDPAKEGVVFKRSLSKRKIMEFYEYCSNKKIRILNVRKKIMEDLIKEEKEMENKEK